MTSRGCSVGSVSLAGVQVLLLAGCSAGPVHMRIDTGGQRFDDFVIRPALRHGFIERARTEWLNARVVSSEEALTLPRFGSGPSVSTFAVWVHHPLFATVYTGQEPGDEMRLPPVRPRAWSDIVDAEGPLTFSRVSQHLSELNEGWLPAFDESRRAAPRVYVAGLEELVHGAQMGSGDWSRFESEAAARAHIESQLDRLMDKMR